MTKLEFRAMAVKKTADRFGRKAFKWGSNDCAKMAAFHLKIFRHKVPDTGGYKNALGAKKRLKTLGFDTLPDLIDSLGLEEIAPAFALTGDIVSFQADDPIGAIGIVWGNGNMMCFHESHELPVIMTMDKIDKCWKVM